MLKDLKIKSASANTEAITTSASLTDTSMANSQSDMFSQKLGLSLAVDHMFLHVFAVP